MGKIALLRTKDEARTVADSPHMLPPHCLHTDSIFPFYLCFMIALLEAHRANLFAPGNWAQNIVSGVIVGIVALPLGLAFAIASGVRPEQGIYTSIIAGVIVSLFGGSRIQIAGPTGAFIVILAGVVAPVSAPPCASFRIR
jgi:MFS superfamily sulfate permease-like transporter